MNKLILLMAVLLCACTSIKRDDQASLGTLIETYVNDAPSVNGRRLTGSLKEVDRLETHSIVEVNIIAGDKLAATLFTLRGMCNVMRARKERFFSYEALTQKPLRYTMSFPKNVSPEQLKANNKQVYSLQECDEMKN